MIFLNAQLAMRERSREVAHRSDCHSDFCRCFVVAVLSGAGGMGADGAE